MKSVSETIAILEALAATPRHKEQVIIRTKFLAPTLHLDVVSDRFKGVEQEERLELIQSWVDEEFGLIQPHLLNEAMATLPLTINGLTEQEGEAKIAWSEREPSASWVSAFLGDIPKPKNAVSLTNSPHFVHFYGYKGGQGRSTVLALLAKALADDGYRILLLDADVEAPSLDLLFGISTDLYSQTLMGLCGWANEVKPVTAAYSGRTGGHVDLMPCRPRIESADLDFALLAATAPLDTRVFERAAEKLLVAPLIRAQNYDLVMVDHRTGIASSVLPLLNRLPGSAVVFARIDSNIASAPSELRRVVRSIFSATASVPGAFVNFSLDPQRAAESEQSPAEARTRSMLLNELAVAMEKSSDAGPDLSEAELSLNWIDWYLDRALLNQTLPDVLKLQSDNIASLNRLREVLGLPLGRKTVAPRVSLVATGTTGVSSLSGAKDRGQFIHIPEVEKLFVPGNGFTYILGRKGTGKTRLLREMATRGLGSPMLVAADENSTSGLKSQSVEVNAWLERCQYDATTFWWSLLHIAILSSANTHSLEDLVRRYLKEGTSPFEIADRVETKSAVLSLVSQKTLLVDGLETLVPAAKIKAFVTALFDLMGTVQNDPAMATRLVIRAFIREDLASDSVQNIEQQLEGRNLKLKWGAASILNFALSRLPSLQWIGAEFKDVCEEITRSSGDIARSLLTEREATALMLRIFPSRLRRNNLSTATFLRLYFSDTGGDDTDKGTFYPRLYLSFLQKLDVLAASTNEPLDADGRINSSLLNRAYDEASNEFITETKQELAHLLVLDYEDNAALEEDDATKVSKFIAAFAGLSTPFLHEAIVSELCSRTNFTEKSVRESLQRMKAIRMFEDRPGYGGWWRVGQLYKMGLLMKYVRG